MLWPLGSPELPVVHCLDDAEGITLADLCCADIEARIGRIYPRDYVQFGVEA